MMFLFAFCLCVLAVPKSAYEENVELQARNKILRNALLELEVGAEETEVINHRIATNDRWCASSENCFENNECRDNECVPVGRGALADLENCVEIEVKGLEHKYRWNRRQKKMFSGGFQKNYDSNERLIVIDGVYSIMKEKSSNGGKAYKLVVPTYGTAHGLLTKDFYLYWDTSRKTWTFDETLQTERNTAVARSKETANENVSAKRFILINNRDNEYEPASVTCKKYLGEAEDSEMEEDVELQARNQILRNALLELEVGAASFDHGSHGPSGFDYGSPSSFDHGSYGPSGFDYGSHGPSGFDDWSHGSPSAHAEVMIRNEVEVSSGISDVWCLSSHDCMEDSTCIQNQCLLKGNAWGQDLGNCMEIRVRGFDEFNYRIHKKSGRLPDPKDYQIKYTLHNPEVVIVDGVYSIIQDKSSNGGKAFKKLGIQYSGIHGRDAQGTDMYLYWDTSRKQWTFDTKLEAQQDVVARSNEVADDTERPHRFEYGENIFFAGRGLQRLTEDDILTSVRCEKYLGA